MVIHMPLAVEQIISELTKNGYEAYIVGGCVRDSIMGKTPHDWDICTSALPEQIENTFSGFKVIETGIKHGTVTVVIDDEQYEITTYRIDGEYGDHRHPKQVSYSSSLKEDLLRRDFTINAMAYNTQKGLIDYFGGRKDIKNRLIRCVGKADARFDEDALRILRALRFASVLGFNIEPNTFRGMRKNKELLQSVSKERIVSELMKILSAHHHRGLYEYLRVIIPELKRVDIQKVAERLSLIDVSQNVKLAVIFDLPDDELEPSLKSMRFDNQTIQTVVDIRRCAEETMGKMELRNPIHRVREILNVNEKIADDVIDYIKCYSLAEDSTQMYNYAYQLSDSVENARRGCYKISQLAVNGKDMIEVGFSGTGIGAALNYILNSTMYDIIQNEKETQIEIAKKFKEIYG